MNKAVRKGNIRKKICIVIAAILLLWLIVGIVDFMRVTSFEKPLFCIVQDGADDGGSGHYSGLGYSFDIEGNFMPEDELQGVTKYDYQIFGISVKSGLRD
ncbi:MAG: hypothetical protein LUE21_10200 [Oscillospiraceae bacterium]|nr:hypothetical protein [Oscillospiraceae bacterium]